jgi:hypothetical protein
MNKRNNDDAFIKRGDKTVVFDDTTAVLIVVNFTKNEQAQ